MKAVMAALILSLLLLAGCGNRTIGPSQEDVIRPYRIQYGEPERIETYDGIGYHALTWLWPSKGLRIQFQSSIYDTACGWTVSSIDCFAAGVP